MPILLESKLIKNAQLFLELHEIMESGSFSLWFHGGCLLTET